MLKHLTKVAELCALVVFTAGIASGQASTPAKSTKPANPDSVHDLLSAPPFTSKVSLLSEDTKPKTTEVQADILKIQNLQKLSWPNASASATGLSDLVSQYFSSISSPNGCSLSDTNQIYIFHITHWLPSSDSQFQLVGSSWYAYKLTNKGVLRFSGFTGSGDQLIYGKTRALMIGIAGFDQLTETTKIDDFKETYSVSIVQGTPENLQNLGLLLSALGGFANTGASGLVEAKRPTPLVVSIGCQAGTSKLPFTLTITDSTIGTPPPKDPPNGNKASDASVQPGTVSCSTAGMKTPCSSTHSFVSKDRELWDVSIGVSTPGTRETKYSFSNGALQTSVTRHTDLYGMFDIFPGGLKYSKDGGCPHFAVGLPLTSQSFYRPYFGVSENLTGWTGVQKKLSLPVAVNFFAGVVFMKTNYVIGDPATQAAFNSSLKTTRAWKGLFGIEIPIASMVSKIGGKGSSSKSSGKSGGAAGS